MTDPPDVERALWALRAYDTTALATISASGPHVAGVFFAPEPAAGGIHLVLAVLEDSRKLRDLTADGRVAFVCSPGNPSRWIQGEGTAHVPELDEAGRMEVLRRLVAHAPGAHQFVDVEAVRPVIVAVGRLRVVENPGTSLRFDFR